MVRNVNCSNRNNYKNLAIWKGCVEGVLKGELEIQHCSFFTDREIRDYEIITGV